MRVLDIVGSVIVRVFDKRNEPAVLRQNIVRKIQAERSGAGTGSLLNLCIIYPTVVSHPAYVFGNDHAPAPPWKQLAN